MDSVGHCEQATNFQNIMSQENPMQIGTHMGRIPTSLPPPLPPRLQAPNQSFGSSYNPLFGGGYQSPYGYGGIGQSYGGYGGGYGGYGGYNSYGGYGAGTYGRYGGYRNLDAENR